MFNIEDAEPNSEEELFYFESDHLALRGNKDYSELLKHLLILCAQRKQAINDYNKAIVLKKEALADPTKVLEKIINGESLEMPLVPSLPQVPTIDWSKYEVKVSEDHFKMISNSSLKDGSQKIDSPKKDRKINNGTWSTDEQKRLEELLQIYPPEAVEMQRYKKIAEALGNRTIQQVTSRVQKYFLKLYKAGLPVPGRIPKTAEKYKGKHASHKHQRHNHYLWKPTTFFPTLSLPVVMTDLDNIPGPSSSSGQIPAQSTTSNYLITSDYHAETKPQQASSETDLQLDLLRRIRKVKAREAEYGGELHQHVGFKCDYCGEEPMVGTRWHCTTCVNDSMDFCTDCILTQLHSDSFHPISHYLASYSGADADLTDSESNSGSGIKNESSDSEMDEELTEDSTMKQESVECDVNDDDIELDMKEEPLRLSFDDSFDNDYFQDDL